MFTTVGWLKGLNSITFVCGLQKAKFAKAAPWGPMIILALWNKCIWFLNDNWPTLYFEKPLDLRYWNTSSSFIIWEWLNLVSSLLSIKTLSFELKPSAFFKKVSFSQFTIQSGTLPASSWI